MTIGRVDINERDIAKIAGAVIQLEERADADDTGVVRTDTAQSLTSTQQKQARSNIYAAPFDALAYNGIQINGSMDVTQERGVGGTTTINLSYICDGWIMQFNGTMAVTGGQTASAGLFSNFASYLYIFISTAQTSLGAGNLVLVFQYIEGYRIARLNWGTANAQPITIGFWAYNSAGTYSVSVRNSAANRSYVTTYTTTGTGPEYKTVTIPGDTAGTWTADNSRGIIISFAMASGTAFIAPANDVWSAGNFIAASGQFNGAGTVFNAMRITGVVVLPGNEAPSAARSPLIMRPFDQELFVCQRYYFSRTYDPGGLWLFAIDPGAGYRRANYQFSPTMRAVPTVAVTGGTPYAFNPGMPTAGNTTAYSTHLLGDISTLGGYSYILSIKADARL